VPYTQDQIAALDAARFDFSTFDWRRARARLKQHALAARDDDEPGYLIDAREVHVTYSLARGRPIVGERGIEQLATREPISPAAIDFILSLYETEATDAAA